MGNRVSLTLIFVLSAAAQTLRVTPQTPKQGEVVRVTTTKAAASARMAGRSIRLFPQSDGTRLGLMPVPADQKPGKLRLETTDAKGTVLDAAEITVRDAHFPSQNVRLSRAVAALKPAPGETETVAAFRNNVSDTRRWTEPFERPVAGCMSSPFGVKRLINGKPAGYYHTGIDQRSPAGTPIRAIADGVVRLVREYNLHGNVVGVDHGQGLESIYLHMSKFAVTEGLSVKKGDVLGYVGSTGRSTGPHLHWSVFVNGVSVNPAAWIPVKPCSAAKRK